MEETRRRIVDHLRSVALPRASPIDRALRERRNVQRVGRESVGVRRSDAAIGDAIQSAADALDVGSCVLLAASRQSCLGSREDVRDAHTRRGSITARVSLRNARLIARIELFEVQNQPIGGGRKSQFTGFDLRATRSASAKRRRTTIRQVRAWPLRRVPRQCMHAHRCPSRRRELP